MSVYFRIENDKGEVKIIHVRGISASIGCNRAGVITCKEPVTNLFSLYCIDNRALLRSETKELAINGEALSSGRQKVLSTGDVLTTGAYRCTAVMTSSVAESIAYTQNDVTEMVDDDVEIEKLPKLNYRIAHLSKVFPLIPGFELVVGSGHDVSVLIDIEGVSPRHASLLNEGKSIRIKKLHGETKLNGSLVTDSLSFATESVITLEPTGIELGIKF